MYSSNKICGHFYFHAVQERRKSSISGWFNLADNRQGERLTTNFATKRTIFVNLNH